MCSSAVALVVALAAFAALGGYLLSVGVDNEERDCTRESLGAAQPLSVDS